MNIFDIIKKKGEILAKKRKNVESVYKDNRGGLHHQKYAEVDLCLIREHIKSLLRDIGHYFRKKSNEEYLSLDLNIKMLYEAFKAKCSDSKVHRLYYRRLLLRDFLHLSFRQPRIDTCQMCDLYNMQIKGNTKQSAESKTLLDMHQRKAKKGNGDFEKRQCRLLSSW